MCVRYTHQEKPNPVHVSTQMSNRNKPAKEKPRTILAFHPKIEKWRETKRGLRG
uniref:Uncharacterized protein n=1 Tax=Rhizophora mucronata TaxID=61149 RepID=A0A2P2PDM0_RHIMU